MEEFNAGCGGAEYGVVNFPAHRDRASRDSSVADAFGHGDDVGPDAKECAGRGCAQASKTSDDLIEDQQDAVFLCNGAQLFQIAFGRNQHACRAREGFDDDGRDGRGIVQGNDVLQLIRKMLAPGRLAARAGILRQVMGVRQVIHMRQQGARESLAVWRDAAHRYAAEAHAMVATLAANQPGALAFTARPVVGQGDLERGVHGFGP
jgi:hypothetical protein